MKRTVKTIAKAYLMLSIWFLIVLATVAASVPLMEGSAPILGMNPIADAMIVMLVGMLVASVATATLWLRLRSDSRSTPTLARPQMVVAKPEGSPAR